MLTRTITFTAAIALLCGLFLCASAEAVVGQDIAEGDISDFYYTYDESFYPPFYLRYRFYIEDGKKMFFNETRQGGGWPQTEKDVVAHGVKELTDSEWTAFFECIRGGRVNGRSEELLDGDDGPWMYIYWTGDEGSVQEFSFASLGQRIAFEQMCSDLAQDHILTRFFFTRGGYMRAQTYVIELSEGVYYMVDEDGGDEAERTPLDPDFAEQLLEIVLKYDLESWNGFNKNDPNVLDGEGFGLEMSFADGDRVYASGENSFPDHYGEATEELSELFERIEMRRIAGTYRYEEEGFGGDMTITLKEDGTYAFCEGPLSSYMGGGTWHVYYNAVYMTEENGYDLSFMFGIEDGELLYVAMGSDEFPYVHVKDMGRFLLTDGAAEE